VILAIVVKAFHSHLKSNISFTNLASFLSIIISFTHFLIVIFLYQKGALAKNLPVFLIQLSILSFVSFHLSSLSILDNDKSSCKRNLSLELSALYSLEVASIHLILFLSNKSIILEVSKLFLESLFGSSIII
jgi:hypothetical protein